MDEQAESDTEILLVEDNPGDIRLIEEALRETASTIHITRDGKEALNFLRQDNGFSSAPHPDLVLLDLNLPKINGSQVLNEIRSDPILNNIRVVVTTSAKEWGSGLDQDEIDEVNFITKPSDPDEYMSLIRAAVVD